MGCGYPPKNKPPPHLCYHVNFGSSASKGVCINRRKPPNWERWVPAPLRWGRGWPLEIPKWPLEIPQITTPTLGQGVKGQNFCDPAYAHIVWRKRTLTRDLLAIANLLNINMSQCRAASMKPRRSRIYCCITNLKTSQIWREFRVKEFACFDSQCISTI